MTWFKIKEAAEKLSLSERHLRRKIKEGAVQSKKDPNTGNRLILIDEEEEGSKVDSDVQVVRKGTEPKSSDPEKEEVTQTIMAPIFKKSPLGRRRPPSQDSMATLFEVNDGLNELQNGLLGFYRLYPALLSVAENNLPDITKYRRIIYKIHQCLEMTRQMAQRFSIDSKMLQVIHGELEKIRDSWLRFFPAYEDVAPNGNIKATISMADPYNGLLETIKNIRQLLIGLTDGEL